MTLQFLATRQSTKLSGTVTWKVPSDTDLKHEYEYEYLLPRRDWPSRCRTIGATYPLFFSLRDFITKVKASKIAPIASTNQIYDLTDLDSLRDVRDMVAGYARPRDVTRIVKGFREGSKMPLPIIISGPKGDWILSGNTRTNVGTLLGMSVKAIWVKVR